MHICQLFEESYAMREWNGWLRRICLVTFIFASSFVHLFPLLLY